MIIPEFHNASLFNINDTINKLGGEDEYFYAIKAYILFSIPLKELIFRGGLQSYLQLLFTTRKTKWLPIILANLVFATINSMANPICALVSFFPGLYWGWLFAKYNNLIGVCLSSYIFTITLFFIIWGIVG